VTCNGVPVSVASTSRCRRFACVVNFIGEVVMLWCCCAVSWRRRGRDQRREIFCARTRRVRGVNSVKLAAWLLVAETRSSTCLRQTNKHTRSQCCSATNDMGLCAIVSFRPGVGDKCRCLSCAESFLKTKANGFPSSMSCILLYGGKGR
jgi:hypothetical protein